MGEGLVCLPALPVPGSVIGMLLLLAYLIVKKDTASQAGTGLFAIAIAYGLAVCTGWCLRARTPYLPRN
ncbi:Hypothetical protein; putative membrane protein [Herminiimonas arsenicoxydans]|uniref:Uncharacterized protein n=1 Tax=Herminiimonas arsenicoxydans TaxID=204773 RepID=A4G8V8_HERAR|nr:Hypothetical protein; putative membrane protein [Herminiimonas arsenicoxydans]